MNQEHEQGLNALEACLTSYIHMGKSLSEMPLDWAGITHEDLELIRHGEKFMTEEQFYGFLQILRSPMQLHIPLTDWILARGYGALTGILQPTFSLNGVPVRAIFDFPHVIINNKDIHIRERDSLVHIYPDGFTEELFIDSIEYEPYSRGYKPIYTLTVTRSKPNMQNNNINIQNMSGNARINSGYFTDNSSNEIHEFPAGFFEQARALLAEVNESHKQELVNMLAKTEAAYASGNKKECGNWFGQFFSLAFTADCITVLQPLLPLISWLMTNV